MSDNTTLFTLHGHNMFDVSSMVQKAIRRGLITDALYAAHEMMYQYRAYLWKRLLTVSAEDCNGLVTNLIFQLKKLDNALKSDAYISSAVCVLVNAKKNRDADYFVCNLFNNKKKIDIEAHKANYSIASYGLYTHNWHEVLGCKSVLLSAIKSCDVALAGYCGFELYLFHRPYFWKCVKELAEETKEETLLTEISALADVDMEQSNKADLNQLFASKAIVLLLKFFDGDITPLEKIEYVSHGFDALPARMIAIPNYVYDCHTRKGRMAGKTTEMFIKEEQRCLSPKDIGLFDSCGWDAFLDMLKSGFENTSPAPPKASKNELVSLMNGVVQQQLF